MDTNLRKYIRDVPDYPKPSIVFRDIAPLLADPEAFNHSIDLMVTPWREEDIDCIGMLDARGFIFGSAMALDMGLPFFMIRKTGKLPGDTHIEEYDLEYGKNSLCVQKGAFKKGAKVLLVDDVLATGGSAAAAGKLISKNGGEVLGLATLIELSYCPGRKIFKYPVTSCIVY